MTGRDEAHRQETTQVLICLANSANAAILADWLSSDFTPVECDVSASSLLQFNLLLTDVSRLREMHNQMRDIQRSGTLQDLQTVPVILLARTRRPSSIDVSLMRYVDEIVLIPTRKDQLKQSISRVLERAQRRESSSQSESLAAVLAGEYDLSTLLQTLLSHIINHTPFDVNHVVLIEDSEARLRAHIGYGSTIHREAIDTWSASLDRIPNPYRQAFAFGKPVIGSSTLMNDANLPQFDGLASFVVLPLKADDSVIGFIVVGTKTGSFEPRKHASWLESIAADSVESIEHAIHHERSRAAAIIEERQRLARELHDSVTQTLFSASMIAEAIPRQWSDAPPDATDLLRELHHLTRGALAEARLLLLEMRPNTIQQLSFDELLRQLTEGIWSRKRVDITFKIEPDTGLSVADKLGLYRITQEALNNIIKHAQATHVSIRFRYADRWVLEIVDDGVGFNVLLPSDSGMGLNIMRERAEMINAHLTIYSDDSGTRVIVER